jgi:cbb3-type cytochrome oxidase subunit 1
MMLTTSDWIVIIGTIVQVVVMISLGILQLMAMRPKTTITETQNIPLAVSNIKWFIGNVWPFLLSFAIAVGIMWHALASDGNVTRSFVVSLIFGALLLAFSILTIIACVLAFVFRPTAIAFNKMAERWKI